MNKKAVAIEIIKRTSAMNYQFCIKFLLNYFKIVGYLVFIVFEISLLMSC